MKIFRQNRKSVWVSLLVSYTLILFVSVIVIGFVYLKTEKITQHEINRTNSILLKQVQQTLDSQVQFVKNMSYQIARKNSIQGLVYAKQPLQNRHRYNIMQTVNDLSLLQISNNVVESFYIYFKNLGICIGPGVVYDPELVFDLHYKNHGMTYEEWLHTISQTHIMNFITLNKNGDNKGITCVQSMPIEDPDQSSAVIIIKINKNAFQQELNNIQLINEGTVLIIDNSDNIIASTQPTFNLSSISYEQFANPQVLYSDSINNEKVLVSYTNSNITDWKYVTIIPTKTLMDKADYLNKLMILTVLLWIIIGFGGALLLSRRNYKPLKQLTQSIAAKTSSPASEIGNEYSFIDQTLSQAINEKIFISKKIEQQKILLKENVLIRLLKGKLAANASIQNLFDSYDLHFNSNFFAVLLFYIEDYSIQIPDIKHMDIEKNIDSAQLLIDNIISEMAGQPFNIYTVDMDGMIACIVNISEERLYCSKNDLLKVAHEVRNLLKESLDISFMISVSDAHEGVDGIKQAYQDTMEAMEYKMVIENMNIIHHDDVKNTQSDYFYSIETEHQLINCIKSGSFEKAKEIIGFVFASNLSKKLISIDMARCLKFNMVSTMVKIMEEISSIWNECFAIRHDPIEQLLNSKSMNEMNNHMLDVIRSLCDHIDSSKKSHNEEIANTILEFIEKHYENSNLDITMIADTFDMNAKYLSSLFKEQTGENLSEYINKVRLKKAKLLLCNSRITVTEAALRTGYNNSNTFIRVFKKYEGITPGKYKQAY